MRPKFGLHLSILCSILGFYACQSNDNTCLDQGTDCTGESSGSTASGTGGDSGTTAGMTSATSNPGTSGDGEATSDGGKSNVGGAPNGESTSADASEGGGSAQAGGPGSEDTSAEETTTDPTGEDTTTDETGEDTGGTDDFDLVIFDGAGIAVTKSENSIGAYGSFYVRQDSFKNGYPVKDGLTHSEVTPLQFGKGNDQPCIDGTVARVPTGQYTAVWGALIGLELAAGEAWDATTHELEGMAFDLGGSISGARLRFEVKVHGSSAHFCDMIDREADGSGHFEVRFDDLEQDCFGSGGSAVFDPAKIEAIEWIIMADAQNDYVVESFCIQKIEAF